MSVFPDAAATFGLSAKKRTKIAAMRVKCFDWLSIGWKMGWQLDALQRYYDEENKPLSLLNPFSDAPHLAQLLMAESP